MEDENEIFNEEVLKKSEFATLLKHASCGICAYKIEDGRRPRMMYMTDGFMDICEGTKEEIFAAYEEERLFGVQEDYHEEINQIIAKAVLTGEKQELTYEAKTLHGKKKWCCLVLSPEEQERGDTILFGTFFDITKQMKVQNELRANQQILESVTKNAGVWYWNCYWRENIAYIGERFQQDFNLPEKFQNFCTTMCQKKIIDEVYHRDFEEMCQRITNGEREAEVVVKGYLPDGTPHWMHFKMTNIFNEHGIPQQAVGVMRLVDDMKDMERKYEIERRHALEDKDLLAHCCINVSTWKVIDYLTEQGDNHELSVDDVGRNISKEAFDSQMKQNLLKLHNRDFLLQSFENGNLEFSYEYQKLLKSGKCIWVRSAFHLMMEPNGNEILLFEYCYDVNVKKTMNILMEFAVNDDYDLMGFVNMQDKDAIMIYGKKSYNPHDSSIVEENYDVSLQKFVDNAIVKEDKDYYLELANLSYVTAYLEEHESLEFYFNMKNASGKIQAKKVCYLKYNGDNNCIIFIQSDITQLRVEQKKNQEALEEALKNAKVASRAKTSFLSQMSHEIRTPMNAIVGMAKLAGHAKDKEEMTQYLQQIDASSQYLLGIINDILDMSRIESGKLELHPRWCDGCKVVLDCIEMLKSAIDEKKITFLYPDIIKNSPIRFYLDPLRVQQIYMNLLNNAIKFTPEGGTIELTLRNISYNGEYGRDQIQIRDTGCGMSQEFLKRIFRPFEMEENEFSSQVQGTGLGLALVKSYIKAMGGDIWVESELGKGSTFTFEIPYQAKTVEIEEEMERRKNSVSLKGRNILLVDDHPLNLTIAKKLLEHEGMIVTTAANGEEACHMYEEKKARFFDAVLMDIRMPKLNGFEATKKIRKMDKEDAKTIPIIAMTANAFDEDVQMSLDAGMNAHLAKPIQPEVMYETLAQWIGNI